MNFATLDYETQLSTKIEAVLERLRSYSDLSPQVFRSPETEYRMRAEFRVWHENGVAHYAMTNPDTGRPYVIENFPAATSTIQRLMPRLLEAVNADEKLSRKLFTVEFLSTTTGECLVTLIYHRPLDNSWSESASSLEKQLDCKIIGRSRKQKLVLSDDFVIEEFEVENRLWLYQQIENSFTQPNATANQKMLEWACNQVSESDGDLLELYCGNGNFTLPLSRHFRRVLTTEISKTSIRALKWNLERNSVHNVDHARLSAEEITQALDGVRPFRRLAHLDLNQFQFSTFLVDPPRAGLDALTIELAKRFDRILYISCNPETLINNLAQLDDTHKVESIAFFDQFPFTPHLECGLLLSKRSAD